jgi:hypothetical protein
MLAVNEQKGQRTLENHDEHLGFEIPITVAMKSAIFSDVTPCSHV